MPFIDKLVDVEETYNDIIEQLSDPNLTDNRKIQDYMKKKSEIEPIVDEYKRLKNINKELEDIEELLSSESDEEMRELANSDKEILLKQKEESESSIQILFLPKDKNEGKNIIVEIRAGTGGDESALFVADLYRMYSRFIERQSLKMELLDESPTGLGGYKEIIFSVAGKEAYKF